jgi:hypothetical protein
LMNAVLKIRDLPAHSIPEIQRLYQAPRSHHAPELLVMFPRAHSWSAPRPAHAVAALQQGYWLANCRSDLALPHIYVARASRQSNLPAGTRSTFKVAGTTVPISNPAPLRIAELTHNRLTLEYDPHYRGWITLNLSMLDTFTFNAERSEWPKNRARFKASDLAHHRLEITARYPGPREGALASTAGLFGAGVFFWNVSRKRTR